MGAAMTSLRWTVGAVVFCGVQAAQFLFQCSFEREWCLIFGTPLSLAAALVAARPFRARGGAANRVRFAILVSVLALIGAPAYLLGHICG
jgi:hypothetical protein